MAATDKIGKCEKIVIVTTDALGKDNETNLNKSCLVNREATYQEVNDAARAIADLSRDTYYDAICVTNISTNEELAG